MTLTLFRSLGIVSDLQNVLVSRKGYEIVVHPGVSEPRWGPSSDIY